MQASSLATPSGETVWRCRDGPWSRRASAERAAEPREGRPCPQPAPRSSHHGRPRARWACGRGPWRQARSSCLRQPAAPRVCALPWLPVAVAARDWWSRVDPSLPGNSNRRAVLGLSCGALRRADASPAAAGSALGRPNAAASIMACVRSPLLSAQSDQLHRRAFHRRPHVRWSRINRASRTVGAAGEERARCDG